MHLYVHVRVPVYEWSAKGTCAYQLDGNMFIVVQILPCSVERGEREREREK